MCCHFAVSLNTLEIYERQNESNFKLSLKLRQLKNRHLIEVVFQHFHRCDAPHRRWQRGGLGEASAKPPPRKTRRWFFNTLTENLLQNSKRRNTLMDQ